MRFPIHRRALEEAGVYRAFVPPTESAFAPIHPRFEVPASAWLILVALVLLVEVRTSALQSWVLARYAGRLSFEVGPGPSPVIEFPRTGPFNEARGYTRLRDFQARLSARGYKVAAQSRFSGSPVWV